MVKVFKFLFRASHYLTGNIHYYRGQQECNMFILASVLDPLQGYLRKEGRLGFCGFSIWGFRWEGQER